VGEGGTGEECCGVHALLRAGVGSGSYLVGIWKLDGAILSRTAVLNFRRAYSLDHHVNEYTLWPISFPGVGSFALIILDREPGSRMK